MPTGHGLPPYAQGLRNGYGLPELPIRLGLLGLAALLALYPTYHEARSRSVVARGVNGNRSLEELGAGDGRQVA